MQESLLKDETLTHKLISKWWWMYLFAILGMPLGYIIRVLISNDLSVWEVGIIYWLISLIWLLSILSSLWLNQQALVYFLPKYYVDKNSNSVTTIYSAVRYINLFMTVLFTVSMILFIEFYGSSYIDYPGIETILYIFLGYFIITNLSNPLKWVFKAFQDVFAPKFSEFIKQGTITITALIIFILWVWTLYSYALWFLIWNIVLLILLIFFFRRKYASEMCIWVFQWEWSIFRKLLNFWLHGLIAANALMIIHNIDMQMLLVISGTEDAWYYTNYMSLIGIVAFLLTPLISLLFPIITELHSKWNIEKLRLLQDFFYKYILIFTLSVVVLLWVFWEVLWVVLYGEDFLMSGTLLQYLAVFWIFQIIFTINFAILMGIWRIKERTQILVWTLILNIILNLILIPLYWALWAWLATGVSWVVIALSSFYYVHTHLRVNFNWRFYIKNIFIISLIWVSYYIIWNDIFILENTFRFVNLIYLLTLWWLAYLILSLSNLWEIKMLLKELKSFRNIKKHSD